MNNINWIRSGKTGCSFASLFSKNPELVHWIFIDFLDYEKNNYPEDTLIISIEFPNSYSLKDVRKWSLEHDFYEESTSDKTVGLRKNINGNKAWVQYFGPDSHVVTRQSPQPMLMFTRKLGLKHYAKVGFKGILHLAHAYSSSIGEKVYDLLWDRSYKQTERLIGKRPTIIEASKTTWLK